MEFLNTGSVAGIEIAVVTVFRTRKDAISTCGNTSLAGLLAREAGADLLAIGRAAVSVHLVPVITSLPGILNSVSATCRQNKPFEPGLPRLENFKK